MSRPAPRDGSALAARWPRRQALKVLAASLALPAGMLALGRAGAGAASQRWSGESLGGPVGLTLWHQDRGHARRTLAHIAAEVARLDAVFSLYRHDSEIAALNRSGRLSSPSADFVAVLGAARQVFLLSGGAFDPTVQPLWRLHADAHANGAPPSPASVLEARSRVGFQHLEFGPRSVRFAATGMAVTLNGVAQGYITDRVADLLRNEGFEHAMVELGETRALGAAVDGAPFIVSVRNPQAPWIADREVKLADAALSVSGGYGMTFGAPEAHHIFDPRTGRSALSLLDVAVIAPRAMHADALSTAICVAGEGRAAALLAAFPGARAVATRADGTIAHL
ncbi:MAG: FAD:protein FMN transferase [Paracoccaceae bacterium]